jgi:hypothetical protein
MKKALLLLLTFVSSLSHAADLAIYSGYWGKTEGHTVSFKVADTSLSFDADPEPLVRSSDIVAVEAVGATRAGMRGGMFYVKLTKQGREKYEQFINRWAEEPDPSRNILFVINGEALFVEEVVGPWFSIDRLIVLASTRSEAKKFEALVNGTN